MDNHPIPQDVTGFQFRLIGNMTVKQFAYVAIGCVSAVILYYVPISGFFTVIKIILIPLFILGGVMAAFVPIEGRPIDVMVTQFLKAVFAPTQFVYQQTGGHLLLSTLRIEQKIVTSTKAAQESGIAPVTHSQAQKVQERQQQLAAYLANLEQAQAKDDKDLDRLSALFQPSGTPPQAPVVSAPQPETTPLPAGATKTASPSTQPLQEPPKSETVPVTSATPPQDTAVLIQADQTKIAQEDTLIQEVTAALMQAKAEEQAAGSQAAGTGGAHAKVLDLERKLQEIMTTKQQLEQELAALKTPPAQKIITAPPVQTVPISPIAAQPAPSAMQQPTVPAAAPTGKGNFPNLPDVPNILLGMVKDSSGNVLPNILVEVKDAEENPVRAFKTNQLGQFMSATPLKEGNYILTFEDAKNQYRFDPVTVVVNNQILSPLEIAAHDLREELRKSLFA
jgi:hypothetical protein